MTEEKLKEIIDTLSELKEDMGVPKNIKNRINHIIEILNQDLDLSISVNKVSSELDEILDDTNIQSYT
ncbi:MAG TPA: hypothetical protein ENL45_01100, partial [Candidatus Woesearchaeota archaeon]|nr:hypothetical protein [Candidatus Woesearchaeota archaeon]